MDVLKRISLALYLFNILDVSGQSATMIDLRDGNPYRTVKIGKQVWMAENLKYNYNHAVSVDSIYKELLRNRPDIYPTWLNGTFLYYENHTYPAVSCYNDSIYNCDRYGYFYNWETANKVCPMGWHLPSKEEYNELLQVIKGKYGKSGGALAWGDSGFQVLFGGRCDCRRNISNSPERHRLFHYHLKGTDAFFWTSSGFPLAPVYLKLSQRLEGKGTPAVHLKNILPLLFAQTDHHSGLSVRCIMDGEENAVKDKPSPVSDVTIDSTLPKVYILSPSVSRQTKLVIKSETLPIWGKAMDASGVSAVSVNAMKTTFASDGSFSATIPLSIGDNEVVIQALDVKGNMSTDTFHVSREGMDVPSSVVASTGIPKTDYDIDVVWIPGGVFQMGSPENEKDRFDSELQHTVTVGGFYLGMYEVTVEQFRRFVEETGYLTDAEKKNSRYSFVVRNLTTNKREKKVGMNWRYDARGELQTLGSHPVVHVNWYDAVAYANWLSEKTGKKYRLPTEAEWEYASRGGQTYLFSGGNYLTDVGWYLDNSDGYNGNTHSVGQKKPNGYGLYDMSGNVYEWCQDWYGAYDPNHGYNPNGPLLGTLRVLRGGSCYEFSFACRVAFRSSGDPHSQYRDRGFRLAVEPE